MEIKYQLNGKTVTAEEFRRDSSQTLREMLKAGKAPWAVTDATFLAGHCNGNQFEGQEAAGDFYAAEAEKAGVDPKGKVYLSGLAAYPGDPRAWVSGRGDVQRLCEERGWDCEGSVNVKAFRPQEPTRVAVGADIVAEQVERELEANPGTGVEEATERVKDRITPYWAKQ